jgi:tetratricopeptide (TPR) repeat protein
MDFYQSTDDFYNKGIDSCDKGDYKDALESFDQALKIKPDFYPGWYNRGVALFFIGDYDGAIKSYDQALEIKPDFYPGWYNRGEVLVRLTKYQNLFSDSELSDEHKQQYRDAIASYEKALEIKPDFHQAWYDRAECYAIIQKGDLAIKDLEEAIQLNPEYKTQAKTNTYFDEIREDERFKKLIED